MTRYSHLTNNELIAQLLLRDDLSELEHELLDRFIISNDELARMQEEADLVREAGFGVHD